jgi:hypothetical protein
VNTDDPNNDSEDDFDYEALRKRRLEELGGEAPESAPKKRPAREKKATPRSKSQPKSRPKRRAPTPPPKRSAVPDPERSAAGFPELTPLEPEIQPSTVDRKRLPTSAEPPPRRASSPPREPPRRTRPSSILITLGGACIALFVVLQIVHSGTSTTSSSPLTPTQTAPAPGPTTATGTTPTPPPVAAVRWSHAVLLPLNTPYSFGSYPLTRTQSFGHGLEVDRSGQTAELVADGDGDTVSQWPAGRPPSAANCRGTSGGDRVTLGGSGVPVGGWVCAHSGTDDLRLKYLSGQSGLVSSSYRFLATVWNPGGGG